MNTITLTDPELEAISGGDVTVGGAAAAVVGAVVVGALLASGVGEVVAAGYADGTVVGFASAAYSSASVALVGYVYGQWASSWF